jgi:hypothetical protein
MSSATPTTPGKHTHSNAHSNASGLPWYRIEPPHTLVDQRGNTITVDSYDDERDFGYYGVVYIDRAGSDANKNWYFLDEQKPTKYTKEQTRAIAYAYADWLSKRVYR